MKPRLYMSPDGGDAGGGSTSGSESGAEGGSPQTGGAPEGSGAANDTGGEPRAQTKAPAEKKKLNNEFLSSKNNTIQKTRGKVGSLEDIKKLAQKSRQPGAEKLGTVEVDPGAKDPKTAEEVASGETDRKKREPKGSAVSDPVEDPINEETEVAEDPEAEKTYEPKLKYKAYDQEHEVPELFQSLIKDPESERQVHEVFEKLHGFDRVKANLQGLDQFVREKIAPELNTYRQTHADFAERLSRGDFFGAMKKIGLPEEKVLQSVVEHLKLRDMPPEARMQYEQRMAAEEKATQSERQLADLERRVQESERSAKLSTFESTLARGDVAAIATTFDERMGRPGAFRQMVAEHGDLTYRRSEGKIDLSPEQAIQEVIRKYGLTATPPAAKLPPKAPNPSPQGTAPRQPQERKVIPNVGSKSASTARSRPEITSVDDIRKERKLRFGR